MKNILLISLFVMSLISCEKSENQPTARVQSVDLSGTYSSTTACTDNGHYVTTAHIIDGGTKLVFIGSLLHGDTILINVDNGNIQIPLQTFDYINYDKSVFGNGTYAGDVVNLVYTLSYDIAGQITAFSCNAVLTKHE